MGTKSSSRKADVKKIIPNTLFITYLFRNFNRKHFKVEATRIIKFINIKQFFLFLFIKWYTNFNFILISMLNCK